MKSYTLKFKKADFISTANGLWRTPIVDLYDNSQYKNYTVKRSNYGTNLLGNGVYTGVDLKSPTTTEVGYKSGDRFIDTSSQVDILAWSLDIDNITSNSNLAEPVITLNVYNAPESLPIEATNPGTWANQQNIRNTGTIYMINAQRYAYFELSIEPMGMSAAELDSFLNNFDITLYIRISIDSPTIDAFFPRTGHMLNMFPEWMDINETDPSDPSYLEMSTPESLGGKFINAIAGEWLTHLRSQIDYQQAQYYIDNVDISQKAWVYRSTEIPEFITSITGDNINLAHTAGITEYHETLPEDHAFFWNKRTKEVFTNLRYNNLLVNGERFSQEIYHIWNSIDDLGATVDLRRHRFEPNEDFRLRIKDVFINKPEVSLEGFKKAIRRELDLWQFYDPFGQYVGEAATPATPNSYITGATPSVLEMSDIEKDPLYFDSRGRPLQRFKDLVEELAIAYPITWGYFKYDQAFWDPDGIRRLGFGYLPKTYDATPPSADQIDSGVGDGNDLYVFRPDFKPAQIPFSTNLKLRGRQKQTRVEYQPIQFDVAVYGRADRNSFDNPQFGGWFTIEVTTGGVVYFSNVYVETKSDVDITMATPTNVSRAVVEWANAGATPTGYTNAGYLFYRKTDGAIYGTESATPYNMIPLDTITNVVVKPGRWNPLQATPGYTDVPTQSSYRAWFEIAGVNPPVINATNVLGLGGSAVQIQKPLINFVSPNIIFESELTAAIAPFGFITYPGKNSNYTTTPDAAPLDITGDICIVAKIRPTSWTGLPQTIAAKWDNSGTGVSWRFLIHPSGVLQFLWSTDGTIAGNMNDNSSVAVTAPNNEWLWVAVSFDVNNGAGGRLCRYWTSLDGTTWTELGTSSVDAGTTSIAATSAIVSFGLLSDSVSWTFIGDIAYVSINNGIGANATVGGTPVFVFNGATDLKDIDTTTSVFPVSTGQLMTVHRAGTVSQTAITATPPPFSTEPHFYTITLNNLSPATTPDDFVLTLPDIQFPSDATNREIVIENITLAGLDQDELPVYGAFGTELAATPMFIPYTLLEVDGDNTWFSNNLKFFPVGTTSVTFSTGSDSTYPVVIPVWSVFEASMMVPITGTVDANGPWREGLRPPETNTNNVLQYMYDLDRNDFGLPNTDDYIVTWIGIESTTSPDVLTWIDSNTVIPAVTYEGETNIQIEYPANAVVETLDGGVYKFSSFPLYARLNAQVNERWQPNVHSGYFYDDDEEYYLYASPNTVMGSSTPFIINGINRQGAPIIVFGRTQGSTVNHYDMRQVSNFVMDTNATPATPSYSLVHTETMEGDGSNKLYTAYDDIYNVTVKDLTYNTTTHATPITTTTSGNEIVLGRNTLEGHTYEVTYRVKKSYYVEQVDDYNKTKVVFDDQGYPTYGVTYETSLYNPATPVDIALNTLYTSIDEGFIYIDHDVHNLEGIEVRFSPSRITADGIDYGLVSVRTTDDVGNPKPFVRVDLFTNFGTLSTSFVTTDANGFAYANLTSEAWDGSLTPSPATPALLPPTQANGYLGRVLGVVNGTVQNAFADFDIQVPAPKTFELLAVPSSDAILADGNAALSVVGRIRNAQHQPVSNAVVRWKKGRYVHDALDSGAYIQFAGGAGNYATTSGNAAVVTGDLSIVAKVSMPDWTTTVGELAFGHMYAFVSKWDTSQKAYAFGINGGQLTFLRTDDGTTTRMTQSEVVVDFKPNSAHWVAFTFDVDNGIGGRTGRFWQSNDGISWTLIGDPGFFGPPTASVFGSSAPVRLGSDFNDVSTSDQFYPFNGRIYNARIYNGIGVNAYPGGDLVFDFNADEITYPATPSSVTTDTVRMNLVRGSHPQLNLSVDVYGATPGIGGTRGLVSSDSSGRFVIEPFISSDEPGYWFVAAESSGYARYEGSTPKWSEVYASLPGTAGNYLMFPDEAALDITGDITIVAKIAPDDWTPATNAAIVNKFIADPNRSFLLDLNSPGTLLFMWTPDGTGALSVINVSTAAVSAANGTWKWVAVTLDVNNGGGGNDTRFWTSDNGTTWTQLGATVTVPGVTSIAAKTSPLIIGAELSGLSAPFSGKISHISIRNGIGASGTVGGTEVFRFDETNLFALSPTTKSFVATTGQLATPVGSVIFSTGATPNAFEAVGDLVAWYEYPNVNEALDPITNLPLGNNQDATPYWELPNYTYGSKFPINYDEDNRQSGDATPTNPDWIPPKWYAIDRYRQYQMGLRGSSYYDVSATPTHPDYKEQ